MLARPAIRRLQTGITAIKTSALTLLATAVVAALSLWFVSAAVLPEMLREAPVSSLRQALLSSGVQIGFVIGALTSAVLGLPDRIHPSRLFAACAALAALVNASLLVLPIGSTAAIAARMATGALLAGVYPVGMKIAVGWGVRDRGFLVGLLVGAVTLGSAAPYLIAFSGGANWRATVVVASLAALAAAGLVLLVRLGPHHAQAARFDPNVIASAWTNRGIRLAYAGYLGHMWELYAVWTWAVTAMAASFALTLGESEALAWARIVTFAAIAAGGGRLHRRRLARRPDGQGERRHRRTCDQRHMRHRRSAQLRRRTAAGRRDLSSLGVFDHSGFGAVFRAGGRSCAAGAGWQPDDPANRARLYVELLHRAGNADAGRSAWLARHAGAAGARPGVWAGGDGAVAEDVGPGAVNAGGRGKLKATRFTRTAPRFRHPALLKSGRGCISLVCQSDPSRRSRVAARDRSFHVLQNAQVVGDRTALRVFQVIDNQLAFAQRCLTGTTNNVDPHMNEVAFVRFDLSDTGTDIEPLYISKLHFKSLSFCFFGNCPSSPTPSVASYTADESGRMPGQAGAENADFRKQPCPGKKIGSPGRGNLTGSECAEYL